MVERARKASLTFQYRKRDGRHEVVAEVIRGSDGTATWRVVERPVGSTDPTEWIRREETVPTDRLGERVAALERRLGATGAYNRVAAPHAPPGPLPRAGDAPDLTAHAVPVPGGVKDAWIEFFHFHKDADESKLLMAVPRFHKREMDRWIIAEYEVDPEKPMKRKVKVLHNRAPADSAVGTAVDAHYELPEKGYEKLVEPEDYERALGRDWERKAKRMFGVAGVPVPDEPRRVDAAAKATTPRPLHVPAPRPRQVDAPAARPPRKPQHLTGVDAALASTTYRSVRARYLPEETAAHVFAEGELGITSFIRLARREADPREQTKLTLLEAGLRVEYGKRTGKMSLVAQHEKQLMRLVKLLGRRG